ncbi:hypothetical protein CRM22_010920, partial [Opisthorchis felineus]
SWRKSLVELKIFYHNIALMKGESFGTQELPCKRHLLLPSTKFFLAAYRCIFVPPIGLVTISQLPYWGPSDNHDGAGIRV